MAPVNLPAARKLLIAAAGTGGHVMPGLAVAQALRARGWVVTWLGTRTGMERSLVERAGLEFHAVAFSNFRGKGAVALARGILRLAQAFVDSVRIVRRTEPHVVLTTGGYIAVPAGLAAAWLRRPISFLNADAAPQLSLRILLPLVRVVLCGFNGAAAHLAGGKARVSGAPVRAEIAALPEPSVRLDGRTGRLLLLVIGGSLGAQVLNEVVPEALALLAPAERPHVVHQCGAGNEPATRHAYESRGVAVELLPFIEDIAARYAAADLVLCRAGAITVTELCVAGLGAILVPLVAKTTAHQRSNAEFLAAHAAAVHLPQTECTAPCLAQLLRTLTRPRLQQMAQNARQLGRPDATANVVHEIESLAQAVGQAA
ncbi:MAG TPA: undecaprenyldiphospho-muramoylpentapeptide beta-N-acetylglucosaminyltransferase [Burkholderiaceae bacterium]|nr:undecaprenyldiphospho-muramoylpentapeptide beta-N-acetylglucosaminyltransferase [Burkholderiaceae bacterium]